MKTHEFSIEIYAPKEVVWGVLWNDETFRNWAGIIDEGTYMKGELEEGNEVQFISAPSGYGVISYIQKLIPNEHIVFRQMADTQNDGEQERAREWTGGEESYSLSEKNGITTLSTTTDIPENLTEIMSDRIPKALQRIKELAE